MSQYHAPQFDPTVDELETLKQLEMGQTITTPDALKEHLSGRLYERGFIAKDAAGHLTITPSGRALIKRRGRNRISLCRSAVFAKSTNKNTNKKKSDPLVSAAQHLLIALALVVVVDAMPRGLAMASPVATPSAQIPPKPGICLGCSFCTAPARSTLEIG